jgi:hypothetical protein
VCPTPSNEDSVRSKIVTADEAIVLIRDGDTLSSTGFVQIGFAEALLRIHVDAPWTPCVAAAISGASPVWIIGA